MWLVHVCSITRSSLMISFGNYFSSLTMQNHHSMLHSNDHRVMISTASMIVFEIKLTPLFAFSKCFNFHAEILYSCNIPLTKYTQVSNLDSNKAAHESWLVNTVNTALLIFDTLSCIHNSDIDSSLYCLMFTT